jgi:serine protease AprX
MATDRVSVGGPGQPPELPKKLEDMLLRRFVFQTFGRARRTQDSPVVPDVWLRHIRIAEKVAHAHIRGESAHDVAVDLLLTCCSPRTTGHGQGLA